MTPKKPVGLSKVILRIFTNSLGFCISVTMAPLLTVFTWTPLKTEEVRQAYCECSPKCRIAYGVSMGSAALKGSAMLMMTAMMMPEMEHNVDQVFVFDCRDLRSL